jgi:hypothetical protein
VTATSRLARLFGIVGEIPRIIFLALTPATFPSGFPNRHGSFADLLLFRHFCFPRALTHPIKTLALITHVILLPVLLCPFHTVTMLYSHHSDKFGSADKGQTLTVHRIERWTFMKN